MKKVMIGFLLASVLTGAAFAELTFSGDVFLGIQLINPPNADESIVTHHREYGAPEFNLTATVTRENYGARVVTRYRETLAVRGIYGWVDFPGFFEDDSLRLSMGRFAEGIWVMQLDSDLPQLFLDNITGFRLIYNTPIQGLSVGAAFRAAGHDNQEFAEEMIFGGTFTTPHFTALFVYDLSQNVRTIFGINVPSFGFLGLHDLSAGFKLQATGLATWDSPGLVPGIPFSHAGILRMYQRIGYRISWPLSVSLIMGQRIHGAPEIDDMRMFFGPGLTYRHRSFPNLTASLRAIIDSVDQFSTTDLLIRPAIEKSLTGPALFYVQYELRLPDVGSSNPMDRAIHVLGIGLEIRAF